MHNTAQQTDEGKKWEQRLLQRVHRYKVYIPKGLTSIKQIKKLDHSKLREHIKTEGYGK